jgi:hypothetical protein
VNHTTFPAHGTWYSRYAALYADAVVLEPVVAPVTPLYTLPRLSDAAYDAA